MVTYYNLTNVTDANNTLQQLTALNQLASGWFGPVALLVLFALTFTLVKARFSTKVSLLASSTISSIISVILFATGLISFTYAAFAVGLTFLVFFYSFVTQDD